MSVELDNAEDAPPGGSMPIAGITRLLSLPAANPHPCIDGAYGGFSEFFINH
ncbi:hypothetical protein [Kangiella sp.]|uniref:hypothetical protein n=1 Tax=Kangiella sp. TaxID=1920245 RepID=UPI003A9380DB